MARTARAGELETRTARLKLKPRKKPYWNRTGKAGVHIGYRRRKPYGKDANGSWLVRRYTGSAYETEVFAEADDFSDANGASILTYTQAVAKLGAELSEIQQQRAAYSVQNAVDDYLTFCRLNRASAHESEGTLKHYVLGYFGAERPLSALTADEFSKWPAWAIQTLPQGRRKRPRSQAPTEMTPEQSSELQRKRKERINRVINTMLACFNKAYDDGRVPSKDAWARLKKFRGTTQARKRWLDVAECKRLIDACPADFRPILQAAMLTGARWAELCRLRVSDYDGDTLLIAKSKSGKHRHVPLNEEGQGAFAEWTSGRPHEAPIFHRADGAAWNKNDQQRPMRAACEAAQIKPHIGVNALRHTYASLLVKAKTPLAYVADSLGHADTRMVSKHYGHLAPSHVADTVRANLPSFGLTPGRKEATHNEETDTAKDSNQDPAD